MTLPHNVFEIFDVKQYNDLEIRVRGHSRSSKVTPYGFLLPSCSNFVSKMHRFRDMASGDTLVENRPQTHRTIIWHVRLVGITNCEFFDESYLAKLPETRVVGLSDGVHSTLHDPAFALLGTIPTCDRRTDDRRTRRSRKDRTMHSVARVKSIILVNRCLLNKRANFGARVFLHYCVITF